MKKIACFSVLSCLIAFASSSALAKSTVSAGYAQGDLQGVVNKANGFNLKYRYEADSQPIGWLGSFTYIAKNEIVNSDYKKIQYYGLTGGPAFRLADWASIYGVIGLGYGRFDYNAQNRSNGDKMSHYGFSYGAGMQFNPMENVAIDVGYEQSRIRSVDVGTWIAGVGYSF